MLKLIVFDWDGTIVDSISSIISCKRKLAARYHLPEPLEDTMRQVIGLPLNQALQKCFVTASTDILPRITEDFLSLMQYQVNESPLYPGVRDLLIKLKTQGFYLSIATSKSRIELDKAICYHGLSEIFDVTCCSEAYRDKPDPTMLHYIAKVSETPLAQGVMIGDTTTDILFARNAPMKVIAFTKGAHTKTALAALKPDGLANNSQELLTCIEALCHSI